MRDMGRAALLPYMIVFSPLIACQADIESTPTPTELEPTLRPADSPTPIPSDPSPSPVESTLEPEGTPTPSPFRDEDGDGYPAVSDCDDANAAIYPGAQEIPHDTIDQDCDGEDLRDGDGDGYDGGDGGTDCDDGNAAIHPGVSETCDSVDNDCDSQIDEGVSKTYYPDEDGDDYGDDAGMISQCRPPVGYALEGGDCVDTMWSMNPEGEEICDGFDNDCDGTVDASFDQNAGGLADLNASCGSYDRLLAGEIEEIVSRYSLNGKTTVDTFQEVRLAGGHTPGAKADSSWPEGCLYMDDSYFIGMWNGSLATRALTLCFSRGTAQGGGDEVWGEMAIEEMVIPFQFDNLPDSDSADLDAVYYSAEESDATTEVWYLNDSVEATSGGNSGSLELHHARIVIHK